MLPKNPADGERTARIGYEAQDERAANLVYDLLIQSRLEWFKIADPEAGRVDDIQIATIDGELHAYQVKWAETTQFISFADFTRSSPQKPSLIKQLADGWQKLKKQNPSKHVQVYLIHRCIPDYNSPLKKGRGKKVELPLDEQRLPQKPNFQGFVEDCWEDKKWLNHKKFPQGWENALEHIRDETRLSSQEFLEFIANSHLHFNYQFSKSEEPTDRSVQRRKQDIDQLARLIAKLGGGNNRIIEVTRAELLRWLAWESRFEFRFKHEFPVDDKLYQPITQTVSELETAIQQFNSGYLALVGTPGSGKSTTLTQTLRYREGLRIIRYYAYIPDSLGQQGRGEANSFLHDLHLALQRQNISPTNASSQPSSLEELRNDFNAQLGMLHEKWQNEQICTLIIVDGLDHIEREQSPERSFLKELPDPAGIPKGVLFVLGSQTLVLNDLPSRVKYHLEQKRTFTMHPLPKEAVFNIITASNLSVTPSYEQQEQIYTLSNGHPLALRYLLEKLKGTNSEVDFNELLQGTANYRGHIEENYQIYWDKLQQHEKLKELLALLARLRNVFNPHELTKWVGEEPVKLFLKQARHYFREESATRWQFFHNSFRQFILTQTKHNIFGDEDLERHRTYHQRLADYAAATDKLSPWSWEELYHRFGAEEWDKVLELSTQGYFRQQFFNLRPLKVIFEDTALCLKAARIRQDGLAIIRIFLIEKELSDRDSNLGMSKVDLPRLLYELKGIDVAVHYVMDGLQIRISEAEALKFVALLIEKGELQVAEMIFNAAEPLDITNGSTPIESAEESNLKTIQAWAQVVHHFRSLEKIFTVIKQLRADTKHLLQHENPERWHKHVQKNVLMTLTDAIFDSGDENKLNQFKKLLSQREDGDLFLKQLDFDSCAHYFQRKDADEALERLLQRNKKTEFSDIDKLWLIELLFHIRGDKTTITTWLANMHQPDLRKIELGEERLSPFRFRIRFNRLLALLGQSVEPVCAVPDSDDSRERGKILFERSLVMIANLWGHAWAKHNRAPSMILCELQPALNLFSKNWQRTPDRGWYAYERIAEDFYTFLIRAVNEHGAETVQALGEEFDRRWRDQPDDWKTKWQRTIALELYFCNGDKDALTQRLTTLETKLDSKNDNITYELTEQVFAWLKAEQKNKAETLFSQLMRNSFVIIYEKDYQYSDWVNWLGKITEVLPNSTIEDIRRFAHALVTLEKIGRIRGTQDAAVDLMNLVARWHPAYALQLKDWLLDRHSIHYSTALIGILRAALSSPDVPIDLMFIITCHLLIPFIGEVPKYLPRLLAQQLAQQCVLNCSKEITNNLLQMLEKTLETKALPSKRAEWWRGIIQGLQEAKVDDAYFQTKLRQDNREKHYEPNLTVHLKSGERLSSEDALIRITSGQDLLDFVEQVQEVTFFYWDEAVAKVFDTLSDTQIHKLRTVLEKFEHKPILEELFAKRLKALGKTEEGLALLQSLIDSPTLKGWYKYLDGGYRLSAIKAYIEFKPQEGRTIAYDQLVKDYLSGWRSLSFIPSNLENYLPLLFDQAPLAEIWQEIREHVYQLNEFSYQEEQLPPPPAQTGKPSWQTTLLQLIKDIAQIQVTAIREEAHRALCKVCLNSGYDDDSKALLANMLNSDETQAYQALAVLESILAQRQEHVLHFSKKISQLCASPNIVIRTMANELARTLDIQAEMPASRTLNLTYSLELPKFIVRDRTIPVTAILPGEALWDTSDPLEMIQPFQSDFELISKLSRISLENVINRATTLMKTLTPEERWNRQAEEHMKSWLSAANLELPYRHLRPQQALRACHYIVAELVDANKLNGQNSIFVQHYFTQYDKRLSGVEPILRPVEIMLPESEEMGRDSNWIKKGQTVFSQMPSHVDTRVVLAELSQFNYLSWEMPIECRFSMLCHPKYSPPATVDEPSHFFPWNPIWFAQNYPDLPTADEFPTIAIYGNPYTVDLGGQAWLALHPILAKFLGWQLSDQGLFCWQNANGETMVESLWWQDGPLHHRPYHDEICAEGWLVVATAEALRVILQVLGGEVVRLQAIIREYQEDNGQRVKNSQRAHQKL